MPCFSGWTIYLYSKANVIKECAPIPLNFRRPEPAPGLLRPLPLSTLLLKPIASSIEDERWPRLSDLTRTLGELRTFGRGAWRYWRLGEPAPQGNLVHKLYAYTDGRSNDILFRILESKRRESDLTFSWNGVSLETDSISDRGIEAVVRTLKADGVAVVPPRLKEEAVRSLYELASSCSLKTTTYGAPGPEYARGIHFEVPIVETGTSSGVDPSNVRCSVYSVPRERLLENRYV